MKFIRNNVSLLRLSIIANVFFIFLITMRMEFKEFNTYAYFLQNIRQGYNGNLTTDNVVTTMEEAVFRVVNETILEEDALDRLRTIVNCKDKKYEMETKQKGNFWILHNYVRADHGSIHCYESITYATHGDFTFLDNLIPLLERWNAPLSLAMHTPGSDFQITVDSIRYLRDCGEKGDLVKKWTTFHMFFPSDHTPKVIPDIDKLLSEPYNCSLPIPYLSNSTYRKENNLLYYVNVGRNAARESALTHFILVSDIELYPSSMLVPRFLNLVARNPPLLQDFQKKPRVYPLSIFEVKSDREVPFTKNELLSMLREGSAVPFHKTMCPSCHKIPKSKEWMQENDTYTLDVFHVAKRSGEFGHWEPIHIGTQDDPLYDERFSWEGKSDKMSQGYVFCTMDYDFMILNNAFLVHKPGIKVYKTDSKRDQITGKMNRQIQKVIFPELKTLYGTRPGCNI